MGNRVIPSLLGTEMLGENQTAGVSNGLTLEASPEVAGYHIPETKPRPCFPDSSSLR